MNPDTPASPVSAMQLSPSPAVPLSAAPASAGPALASTAPAPAAPADSCLIPARPEPLLDAVTHLVGCLESYRRVPGRTSASPAAVRMIEAFAALFRAALPGASAEVLGALTELCALETARQRAATLLRAK